MKRSTKIKIERAIWKCNWFIFFALLIATVWGIIISGYISGASTLHVLACGNLYCLYFMIKESYRSPKQKQRKNNKNDFVFYGERWK